MSTAKTQTQKTKHTPEPVRHVRVHLPDRTYRAVRHLLADAGPRTSMSEVVVSLIEAGLAGNGGAS